MAPCPSCQRDVLKSALECQYCGVVFQKWHGHALRELQKGEREFNISADDFIIGMILIPLFAIFVILVDRPSIVQLIVLAIVLAIVLLVIIASWRKRVRKLLIEETGFELIYFHPFRKRILPYQEIYNISERFSSSFSIPGSSCWIVTFTLLSREYIEVILPFTLGFEEKERLINRLLVVWQQGRDIHSAAACRTPL